MKRPSFILLVGLVFLAACSEPNLWQGYGGDGARSLCSQSPGPGKPQLEWVVDFKGTNPGALVIDSGGIYVPHSGGSISKYSFEGEAQWRFDSWVGALSQLPPHLVLLNKKVLVSTQGVLEETFILNEAGETWNGAPWLPWPASMSPAVGGGNDYAVICHQFIAPPNGLSLRIYGTKGGENLWHWDFSASGEDYYCSNPVLLPDGRAYVFVENDRGKSFLVALDEKGSCLWQREFKARGVGQAIGASGDGTVFFGTQRIEDINKVYSPGELFAVNSAGELLWQVNAGGRVEQIFIGPGLIVANLLRNKLLAVSMEGQELWEFPLAGWESNGVMDSKGRVYLAGVKDQNIWLRALNAKGKELWELDTGQKAQSISYLALANGVLYLATDCGRLMALSD